MPDTEIAVLLYGNGYDLGNFQFYADDLAAQLVREKKFDRANIIIKQTLNGAAYFSALMAVPLNQKIKELHVFSHSIGGGLYLGYHVADAGAIRAAAANAFPHPFTGTGPRISYDQVVATEYQAALLTDHLLGPAFTGAQAQLRAKFSAGATIKLWGCNSGVSGWVYSDEDSSGHLVSDQNAPAEHYYWRALNTRNVPKPSIAQAFADFFGVAVYGAGSGSHVEVWYNGSWVKADAFVRATGRQPGSRRGPRDPDILRLHPDHGDYNRFSPGASR
jgi:hypothetical protein